MYLGSAIGTAVGQTTFRSGIPGALAQYAPFIDPELVINTGATEIKKLVAPDQLPALLRAYNKALIQIFVSIGILVLRNSADLISIVLSNGEWSRRCIPFLWIRLEENWRRRQNSPARRSDRG
jgi:hypothetical protein